MGLLKEEYANLVDKKLVDYIDEKILPLYDAESVDDGHKRPHIEYVANRSMQFAVKYNEQRLSDTDPVDLNMIYAIACYHDVGLNFSTRELHAEASAKYMVNDKGLNEFFNDEQIFIMSDAIAQHRASFKDEPTTMYGKIVSQADRDTDVDTILYRTFVFRKDKEPFDIDFTAMENDIYEHLKKKYGKDGYARKGMYVYDADYLKFGREIDHIIWNRDVLHDRLSIVIQKNDPEKYAFFFEGDLNDPKKYTDIVAAKGEAIAENSQPDDGGISND